jgi:hypothetical protein
VGFVVDNVTLGKVFSEYFGFPCQISFHRLLYTHHHLSTGAGTIGQLVAVVPSGLSLNPPQATKKKTTAFTKHLPVAAFSNNLLLVLLYFMMCNK